MVRLVVRGPTDRNALRLAAGAIAGGRIVAFPTDTLYGLAVDPRDAAAVASLAAAKGRGAGQALPLIAADRAQIELTIGPLNILAARLADVFWPGPLSILLPAPAAMVPDVHAGSGTVAVRVPAHAVARGLAATVGFPITATSANRSGESPAATGDEVERALGAVVAVLLDAGPTPGGDPSTIVDVTGAEPRLVRDGAVSWARVLESLA
jgi:L-threonylcarbamoyladenylate synthase